MQDKNRLLNSLDLQILIWKNLSCKCLTSTLKLSEMSHSYRQLWYTSRLCYNIILIAISDLTSSCQKPWFRNLLHICNRRL